MRLLGSKYPKRSVIYSSSPKVWRFKAGHLRMGRRKSKGLLVKHYRDSTGRARFVGKKVNLKHSANLGWKMVLLFLYMKLKHGDSLEFSLLERVLLCIPINTKRTSITLPVYWVTWRMCPPCNNTSIVLSNPRLLKHIGFEPLSLGGFKFSGFSWLWVLAIWTPKPTKVPKRNPPPGGWFLFGRFWISQLGRGWDYEIGLKPHQGSFELIKRCLFI